MINLTHTLSATADKITRSGNILTFNGTDYDLSDLSSLPQYVAPEYDENGILTKEGTNIEETPVYTNGTDIFIFIHADTNQFDDLSHGNLMRIHDLNNNGQLELSEFLELVDYLILTEADKRIIRKQRMDAFITPLMSSKYQSLVSGFTSANTKELKIAFAKDFEAAFPDDNTAASGFADEMKAAKKAWMDKGKE